MEIERQEVHRSPRWELPSVTLIKIKSSHIGRLALDSVLRMEEPNVRILAEVADSYQAVHMVREHQPTGILTGADVVGRATTTLIQELHAVSPESRVMVFTDDVDRASQLAPGRSGVYGFILWRDVVSVDVVHDILRCVLVSGLSVMSSESVQEVQVPKRDAMQRQQVAELNEQEYEILRDLATDMTNRAIAQHLHMSDRTLGRILKSLKQELKVPSRSLLVARAWETRFSE